MLVFVVLYYYSSKRIGELLRIAFRQNVAAVRLNYGRVGEATVLHHAGKRRAGFAIIL